MFAEIGHSVLSRNTNAARIFLSPYETNSRNIARRRCAVPDDALDRRVAGREGRSARSGAESARHFLRGLLATALYICPSARLFAG